MIGFSELLNRLKHQEHEAEQHKIRIDVRNAFQPVVTLSFYTYVNNLLNSRCASIVIRIPLF